ncbi:MAG: helix-turn-helix domain-containing protein [Patescibacteria group bacterium]
MINQKLADIGLREDEIATFLFLLQNPGQSAGIIAKKTGLSRPSLYGYLKNLQEKGLVTQSTKNKIKIFSPAPLEKIDLILNEKIREIVKTKDAFHQVFADIEKGTKLASQPRLQMFEGKEEMQHLARELLLYRNTETKSSWPIKLMIESLGEQFFKEFNIERIKRNIYVKALWPEKKVVDMNRYPFMGVGEHFLREIRIAPKEMDFATGYWIFENKVAFVSSKKENFGFLIESQEFTDMMTSQFDTIWKLSKELKVSKKESDRLFKEMTEK